VTTSNHWIAASSRLTSLVLLLPLFMGCGDQIGGVAGTVSYGGKPLPEGRITFLCDGGKRPAVSAEITQGRYAAEDLPAGRARIMVETFPPPSAAPKQTAPGGLPTLDVPDDPQSHGAFVRIPERYKRPDASGLSIEIRTGPQVHDIDLVP